MSRRYCMVCRGEVKGGRQVAMDPLVSFVLSAKRLAGVSGAKGRTIVICPPCMPVYLGMRDKFKGKVVQLAVVALAVFIVQAYFVNVLAGLLFAMFLLSFALFYYVPGLENEGLPARAK